MSQIGLPKGMNRDDAYVQGIADTEARVIKTIHAHIPSLSRANESEIEDKMAEAMRIAITGEPGEPDVADLALRTCACGAAIDGFYDYVDHLTAVFGGESHFGG